MTSNQHALLQNDMKLLYEKCPRIIPVTSNCCKCCLWEMYLCKFAKESTDKEQRSQGLHRDMWECVQQSSENGSRMSVKYY